MIYYITRSLLVETQNEENDDDEGKHYTNHSDTAYR